MRLKYYGLDIIPSRTADKEMVDLKIYIDDVLKILEEGKTQSSSKRKKGTTEKILKIRGKTIKVVVVESIRQWDNEKICLIIHVGDTREKKGKGKRNR